MSFSSINNPLERLQVLPDAMNWRGDWNNTTQYYKNDVVLSPLDSASYIALNVSVLGGADPSVNTTDWLILASATTGVTGLTAGTGISITGTPTIPQINNLGVLTATAGTGITNTNTATDPIFENTGVLSLNVGTGLSSTGGQNPTITNTGVLSIVGSPSVLVTGPSNAPTITNLGVLQVTAGNSGITIGGPPNAPQIFNSGVVSITGGAGISVTGPPATPTITLTATASPPIMSYVLLTSPQVPVPIPPAGTGVGLCSVDPASRLADHLLNGSPDPNGVWILDLASVCYYNDPPAGGTNSVAFGIQDTTTGGGPYTYAGMTNTSFVSLDGNPPYAFAGNKFFLNVADARATGLRVLNDLLVLNDTGGNLINTSFGGILATYYPNGIQ